MKLKEYIKSLQKLVKENPDAANYLVVYAKDDEGNGFEELNFTPSIGEYGDGDFISEESDEEWVQGHGRNAVCIN